MFGLPVIMSSFEQEMSGTELARRAVGQYTMRCTRQRHHSGIGPLRGQSSNAQREEAICSPAVKLNLADSPLRVNN